jgi:anti-sigma factor RsiW
VTEAIRFECAAAREAMHATLDADVVEAGLRERLAAHLADCTACREAEAELRAIQRALRELPVQTFPEAALEEVWQHTVRAGRRRATWGRNGRLAAAAAAVVVVVLGGLWLRPDPAPAAPSEAELQQAAREARLVLRLASGALRSTEQVAFEDVLARDVSDALRRVPIRWPGRDDARRRGS